MPDGAEAAAIRVLSMGRVAGRALAQPGRRHVGAMFRRGFYISDDHAWIFVSGDAEAQGPLTLWHAGAGVADWRATPLAVGATCVLVDRLLTVGGLYRFRLPDAETPLPRRPRAEPETARQALRILTKCLDEASWRLDSDRLTAAVAERARVPVKALGRWLKNLTGPAPKSARDLVGLGPGLTPSGDDYLAGVMLGLHAIGQPEAAVDMHEGLRPAIRAAGQAISAAHLLAARDGLAGIAVDGFLAALLRADEDGIRDGIRAVAATGHTSGWDTLAGVVAVLDAWMGASSATPVPSPLLAS